MQLLHNSPPAVGHVSGIIPYRYRECPAAQDLSLPGGLSYYKKRESRSVGGSPFAVSTPLHEIDELPVYGKHVRFAHVFFKLPNRDPADRAVLIFFACKLCVVRSEEQIGGV